MSSCSLRAKKHVSVVVSRSRYLLLQIIAISFLLLFSVGFFDSLSLTKAEEIYDEEYDDDHIALYKDDLPESYFLEQNITTFGLYNSTFTTQNLNAESRKSTKSTSSKNSENPKEESEEVRSETLSAMLDRVKDVDVNLRDEKKTETNAPTAPESKVVETDIVEGSGIEESGGSKIDVESDNIDKVSPSLENEIVDEKMINQGEQEENNRSSGDNLKAGKTLTKIAEGHTESAMSTTSAASDTARISDLFTIVTFTITLLIGFGSQMQ